MRTALRFTTCTFLLAASGLTLACGTTPKSSADGGAGCGDTTSDPSNCGSCGNVCPVSSVCQDGACQDVAHSLTGLRWQLPCTSAGNPCPTAGGASASEALSVNIAGTQGNSYDVTLRLRGVVEPRTYPGLQDGGAAGADPDGGVNAQDFVSDTQSPSLGDPENIYGLVIADPAQTYYVNSGDSSQHYVTPIDYVVTLTMSAGTLVTLNANSVDGYEWSNLDQNGNPVVVAGVPPYPNPYDGQFVQMDVTAVALHK